MRRFELVEGTSSKFWSVGVEDAELTVTYGRIGTAGQTKTKSFASAAAASAEAAQLIREKTAKGYTEVGGVAPVPTPAPAAKPAKPATPVTQAASVAAPPPPPPPAQPTVATGLDDLPWPQGGFDWDDELRVRVPVVRGVRVPAFTNPSGALSTVPKFAQKLEGYVDYRLNRLVQEGKLASVPKPWTEAEASAGTTRDALASTNLDDWGPLLLQCGLHAMSRHRHLKWAMQVAMTLHGLPFAIDALLTLRSVLTDLLALQLDEDVSGLAFLRHAIAAAPEAQYQEAVAAAAHLRGRTDEGDCVIAYLFPEQAAWAEDCVDRQLPWELASWLNLSVMSPEAALRHWRQQSLYVDYFTPGALLHVKVHGEAALPLLALALDKVEGKEQTQAALKLLLRMRTPGLIPVLVERMDDKEVRAALERVAEHYPAAVLATAIAKAVASRSRAVEGWTVRLTLRLPDAAGQALAACTEAERARFTALLDELAPPEEAPAEALPDLLRTPPWTQSKRPQPVPTVDLVPTLPAAQMHWADGQQAAWGRYQPHDWVRPGKRSKVEAVLAELCIADAAHQRVLAGEPLRTGDIVKRDYYYIYPDLLLLLPEKAAIAVWNSLPPAMLAAWNAIPPVQGLAARYELAVLPGLLAYTGYNAEVGLEIAQAYAAPGFAPLAAHALKNLKKAKPHAMRWLQTHPEVALSVLLPQAFGKDRVARENAQVAVRWLAFNGHEAVVRAVAGRYGSEATAALEALLSADPLLMVPARMPKVPTFFVPAAFRRPALADGRALPLAAVESIGSMLTISRPDEPYGGLEIVKSACQPDSLAEFAWDVFEAWMGAGAPSKEAWAFQVLGWFGNDETARRLAPRIREWPGQAAHARAVAGLDILAGIGTDVALMHLNGIASKVKFKGLQDKAREKIAAVAEARGLTAVELADRLVPDLGLDASGRTVLDFGPRQFYVGFDEALKPFVRDAAGARLKDLPKPNKSDDPALSAAAVERYKGIKKDAKAIASLQVVRLELAMCARRRWSAGDFRLFFLDHPLMRHLACRLVWGVYRDGALVDAFRVAEDLSLADRDDSEYALAAGAEVGIAHVLELPEDMQRDFGQVFADYEILQPFKQLGRETFALTEEERRSGAITRFKDKRVSSGSIMGLVNRGWERGEAQDAGWVGWFVKRLPEGLEVELQLDPGTIVGDLSYEPVQKIPEIAVRQSGTWGSNGRVDLGTLDAIAVSEFIRDADLLAPL